MWRNPLTNRFEPGNPPFDRRAPNQTPQSPTREQSDFSDAAWSNIMPGTDIRDIAGVSTYGFKNQPTQGTESLGPDAANTTSETPHPHRDGGDGPVPKG